MTRPSKRELERALRDLSEEASNADDLVILFENADGDRFRDAEYTEPVDGGEIDQAERAIVLSETVVETSWSADGEVSP